MEPQIVDKENFQIIGLELRTTSRGGRNFEEIPRFWQNVLAAQSIRRIPNRINPDAILGLCTDLGDDGSFSYIIGAEVSSSDKLPADMVTRTFPAATYAVFTARGNTPDAIQQTTMAAYREWLPESGYTRAEGPDIELYDQRFDDTADAEMDIYLPVKSSD